MKVLNVYVVYLIISVLIFSCSDDSKTSQKKEDHQKDQTQSIQKVEKNNGEANTISNIQKNNVNVILSENKDALKNYYNIPHIKEFYEWQKLSFSPDYEYEMPEDISKISYSDLRLKRNEIFARNGYLFNDGFLRGYFNQFNWYMPIFAVDTFQVVLNKNEQKIINTLLNEEVKRKNDKTVPYKDLNLFNSDLVVNFKQFNAFPSWIENDFKKQNFSIIETKRAMPFYVYDENAYHYIPHYITTDLYLFILHKYFSRFLEKLDENFLYKEFSEILKQINSKLKRILKENPDQNIIPSIKWANMFTSLSLYASGDSLINAPEEYKSTFRIESANINTEAGKPSFIPNEFVSYGELKPRGHYTKSNTLKNYFKGFKWISLNGIDLDDNKQFKGMVLFAFLIKNDEKLYKRFERYIKTIEKLAGQEDNLSLRDIIASLPNQNIEEILETETLNQIKNKLDLLKKEKIKKIFGKSFNPKEKRTKRLYFVSSTYSISGEIFSKLVDIDWTNSKRPFPNGLDIPAVFGNKTAENILIEEYKENEKWTDYLTALNSLQSQFSSFNDWNHNYGFKGVETALASLSETDGYPDFMKTDEYNRKELNTTLASWTHIKHDLILYQEKPYAAECGQGGGPKPPKYYCYVEPNLTFWNKAMELVDWLENLAINESTFRDELRRIENLGRLLKNLAQKQIDNVEITEDEYEELQYIGGTIEYILLGLLETDHLPDREKSMALIADVYVYNDVNLNVAVGHADDIYVVVPIEGEYYIARGTVFSYYEFKGKIYNDEEWRKIVKYGNEPERPQWIKPLINERVDISSQMQYRY